MAELPRNGKLLKLAAEYPTDQSLADHLGVPRTTLRDHILRLGVREQINVVRERPEAPPPAELPCLARNYRNDTRHYVYPLGDVHIGAATHHREMWERWLEFLEGKKNASLLGTGDFLNTAILGSKSDVYDEKMTVAQAKRLLRTQLEPLAKEGRIDCLMPGNHEDRITRATSECPIRDVAESLEIPYVEAAAMVVYEIGDHEYEVYVRHGTGNGQALGTLTKSQRVIGADVYITGHTHRQAATADDYFSREGKGIGRRKCYFISSGSFLGYERYAAQRGYPPSRLGAPRVFLDGRRFDIHVSL